MKKIPDFYKLNDNIRVEYVYKKFPNGENYYYSLHIYVYGEYSLITNGIVTDRILEESRKLYSNEILFITKKLHEWLKQKQ